MSDVYESSTMANGPSTNQENVYFRKKHDTIDEEESEDSEFEPKYRAVSKKPVYDRNIDANRNIY